MFCRRSEILTERDRDPSDLKRPLAVIAGVELHAVDLRHDLDLVWHRPNAKQQTRAGQLCNAWRGPEVVLQAVMKPMGALLARIDLEIDISGLAHMAVKADREPTDHDVPNAVIVQ